MSQNITPISIITGFLGSGKTTFISTLIKQKEMERTAVIINEFGEIGLDHELIEHSDDSIIELQSGCICCTIKEDLKKTLLDIADKAAKGNIQAFDRVVIETTGLADPAPIIHTLMTSLELKQSYTLDCVITLVDAINGSQTLDTHPESVKQAAMADCIVFSKTDIADNETKELLTQRLKAINPSTAMILSSDHDKFISAISTFGTYNPSKKSDDVTEWLAMEKFNQHNHHHDHDHHHHHNVNRHSDDIHAFCMTSDRPVSKEAFGLFLEVLTTKAGPNLLRVKGILNVESEEYPVVVHGVQNIFHPPQRLEAWPTEDKRTKIVFITRNIPKKQVECFYNALLAKY